MSFQSRTLAMVGAGIEDHAQPDERFPDLADGNHLRWAFDPTIGFPGFGYYLFRREHVGEWTDPVRLSDGTSGMALGHVGLPLSIGTAAGDVELSGPGGVDRTDRYALGGGREFEPGSDGTVEFAFRHPFRIEFPGPVFEATLLVAVHDRGVEATARWNGVAVDAATLAGSRVVTLSFDRIDAIEIEGAATLVDVLFSPVARRAFEGWEPLQAADWPIALPATHADYPAGTEAWGRSDQDLPWARGVATDRIDYGDPGHYTDQPAGGGSRGSVSVKDSSPIVTGTDTGWSRDRAGDVFRVSGDDTAYVVVEVLPGEGRPDRLVLTRPYEGATASGVEYSLGEDRFGQLHDYLVELIDDASTGGMAGRSLPEPVVDAGTVSVEDGERLVVSSGVSWSEAYEGLQLRVGDRGWNTVTVERGSPTVERNPGGGGGSLFIWGDDLVGRTIRFDGRRERYTVVAADWTTLTLDRPYAGPDDAAASYTVYEPTSYEIEAVDPANDELALATAYRGPDRGGRTVPYEIAAQFGSGSGDAGVESTTPRQRPLDMVLTASLDPAVAQALGLSHVDRTAAPDQSYDYLLVADHDGSVARLLEEYGEVDDYSPILNGLFGDPVLSHAPPPLHVDGYITFDVRRGDAAPLPEPSNPTVYELPAARSVQRTTPSGETAYGTNAAGLGWDRPTVSAGSGSVLRPGAPVQYHLWRHDYGERENPPAGSGLAFDRYELLTAPLSVDPDRRDPIVIGGETSRVTGDEPDPPADWPDEDVYTADVGLVDGWYGYRVGAVDVFGRLSEPSEPATWRAGDPLRDEHAAAIRLADTRAPPPPRAVDATLLDDDTARVTWRWPAAFVEQAPDTVGFRIHYHPGRLNDQAGSVTDVDDHGDGRYTIETDVEPVRRAALDPAIDKPPSWEPADAYAGATLSVRGIDYEVTDGHSTGGADSRLELEVVDPRSPPRESVTTTDGTDLTIRESDSRPDVALDDPEIGLGSETPRAGDACTVTIPPAYKRGKAVVEHGEDTVSGRDTDWTSHLEGQAFTTADGGDYRVEAVLADDELRLDRPYEVPDESERTGSRTLSYAIEHPVRVDFSQPYAWDPPSQPADWQTTHGEVAYGDVHAVEHDDDGDLAYREYEVEVPVPGTGDPATDPFVPDDADPVTYAHFGVNAYDDAHNAGRVSAPVRVARAKEDSPPSPEPPSFENEVDWATPPDYDGQARYTVRWKHPGDHFKTHVFRTMDKALFKHDWQRRRDGATQDVGADDQRRFPEYRRDSGAGDPDLAETRREQIVAGLDDLQAAVTAESTFEAAFEHYRDLDPDVQQVIAALPGNEPAYAQVTTDPLDPDEHPNVQGPDFEAGDPTGSGWCAWVDSFDGRTRQRYFYRTGNVDAAHNRSGELSYPTQPVQAVDTVAPTAPSVNAVVAGHHDDEPDDRAITLTWTPNPERDVTEYAVYRTDDETKARDVRLMEEVATVPQDSPEVTWVDEDRPGGVAQHYRIVAVDEAGNRSDPSAAVVGTAFDRTPPDPPSLTTSGWVLRAPDGTLHPADSTVPGGEPAVELEWEPHAGNVEYVVVRRVAGGTWRTLSEWQSEPGYVDEETDPGLEREYLVRVRDASGRTARSPPTAVTAMGGDGS